VRRRLGAAAKDRCAISLALACVFLVLLRASCGSSACPCGRQQLLLSRLPAIVTPHADLACLLICSLMVLLFCSRAVNEWLPAAFTQSIVPLAILGFMVSNGVLASHLHK
jgi:hypothetical protein